DARAAVSAWERLLETVLRRETAGASSRTIVVTPAQFEQAAEVAELAARRGQPALALRAIQTALESGPPVQPIDLSGNASRYQTTEDQAVTAERASRLVPDRLGTLVPRIADAGAAAEDIERTLRAVVMPESRPGEILLGPAALALETGERPRSVG